MIPLFRTFLPKMFQLVAYRGTGKDTLYQYLKSNQINRLTWRVYGLKGTQLSLPSQNIVRISFADELKSQVCDILDLPPSFLTSGQFELFKDIPPDKIVSKFKHLYLNEDIDNIVIDPLRLVQRLNGLTLRQWCNKHGHKMKKKHGHMHFVNLVRNKVETNLHQNKSIFITDTRYPYEVFNNIPKIQVTTLRLFRLNVKIPLKTDLSEHSMDEYKCDFVLCKTDSDFEFLRKFQRQYKEYTYHGRLEAFIQD